MNTYKDTYRVLPGHGNWQLETAAWIWARFFQCTLETRWLGVRRTCGIGLFYRNYRPLLEETGWLGFWLHQCSLSLSLSLSLFLTSSACAQKHAGWFKNRVFGFLCPGRILYQNTRHIGDKSIYKYRLIYTLHIYKATMIYLRPQLSGDL